MQTHTHIDLQTNKKKTNNNDYYDGEYSVRMQKFLQLVFEQYNYQMAS